MCRTRAGGRGRREQRDQVEPGRVRPRRAARPPPRSAGRRTGCRRRQPRRRRARAPRRRSGRRDCSTRRARSACRASRRSSADRLEHARQRRAGRQRAPGRALQHGTVGHRIRERHPELDQVGAGVDRGADQRRREVERRIARREIRNERGPPAGAACRQDLERCGSRGRHSQLVSQVRGDRPHVLVAAAGQVDQQDAVRVERRRQAHRVRDGVRALERGDDALGGGQQAQRLDRLVVGDGDVARRARCRAARRARGRRPDSRARRRSSARCGSVRSRPAADTSCCRAAPRPARP